jgi:hypothetical protein
VHDGNAIVDVQDAIRDQIVGLLPRARINPETNDVELLTRTPQPKRPYREWDEAWVTLHTAFPASVSGNNTTLMQQMHGALFFSSSSSSSSSFWTRAFCSRIRTLSNSTSDDLGETPVVSYHYHP